MIRRRSTPPTPRPSKHTGQPTVILAKTVKGYGMGEAGEGQNITHQQKKMGEAHLKEFRDRFGLPLTDEQLKEIPFLRFDEGSRELRLSARAARGARRPPAGAPARSREALAVPPLSAFEAQLKGTEGREISTTMAFVRILNTLLRDKAIGKRVVPIVPDESRTFGMEGMFRQFGIFSQVGQLYRPEDANQLMFYKEDKKRPAPAGGDQRAGRDVVLDRGGDLLQHHRYADDPVLHLLLDVRLPARRRPRPGRRATCGRAAS